jgi:hypothetical protein
MDNIIKKMIVENMLYQQLIEKNNQLITLLKQTEDKREDDGDKQ